MSGTAAPSRSTQRQDVLSDAVRTRAADARRASTRQTDQSATAVQDNLFFKIAFDASATPAQKREAMTKTLVVARSKQESRTNLAAFEEFREFLQATREEMSRETIKLTDTEAMSELQAGYRDFNNGIVEFEEAMTPLTDIIDAVYKLRTNGKTFEVFKQIRENREAEAADILALRDLDGRIGLHRVQIDNLKLDIAGLGEQRGFFGFGGIKEAARIEIAKKQTEIDEKEAMLADLRTQGEAVEARRTARRDEGGEFAFEMGKLSELLDLTSSEHKDRQSAVVAKALSFVDTTKERTKAIRGHLTKMTDQIDALYDGNTNMNRVYALMNESLKEAETENQRQREAADATVEGEGEIERSIREERRMDIERHMTALDQSAIDAVTTQAELVRGTARIKNMRDANTSQLAKIRTMQGQGVAGTAERLAATLNAVSAAAVGESQALAKDSMILMNEKADAISGKESIRLAMAGQEINEDLRRALDEMGQLGDTTRTAFDIARANIEEMRESRDQVERLGKEVAGEIGGTIAVNAEVARERSGQSKTAKSGGTPSGFTGLGSV